MGTGRDTEGAWRTYDYEGTLTVEGLCRLFLSGDGHGPAAEAFELYRRFRAFCNEMPTVGVPPLGEFLAGMVTCGCGLTLPPEPPDEESALAMSLRLM